MIKLTFLASIVIVVIAVLGLGLNIFFKKNGKFPNHHISENEEMKKRGIICAKCEDGNGCVVNKAEDCNSSQS